MRALAVVALLALALPPGAARAQDAPPEGGGPASPADVPDHGAAAAEDDGAASEAPNRGEATENVEPEGGEAPGPGADPAADPDAAPDTDPAATPQPSFPDDELDPETERGLDQLMLMVHPLGEPRGEDAREDLDALDHEDLALLEEVVAPGRAVGERPAEPGPDIPFWGRDRIFLSGILDVGFLFLQPRFHLGYGVPHRMWVGAELDPIISGSGIGAYAGVRGEIPWGDLRIGARYRYNWTRSFLETIDGYDHLQLRDRTGPNASYLSAEAQLSLDIPVESTAFVAEATATYVYPFEQGYSLYEDTLRVIVVAPGWVWSVALGWRFEFGPDEAFAIEPSAELVHLVERDDFVLRVGLRASITMWPDLQVRMIAMPGIVSPDSLGGGGGHSFLLGIRYRWATDAPRFGDDA